MTRKNRTIAPHATHRRTVINLLKERNLVDSRSRKKTPVNLMNGEKHEDPNDFLDRLIASVPGILAAMIVSTEGVPIASKPIVLMNQEHVPAMIAVMQSLGKKATLAWQA